MDDDHSQDPHLERVVETLVSRWDAELRRAPNQAAAQRAVRAFLLEFLPARTGGPSTDHAFLLFELASRLTSSDRIADAFDVLDWIGELYACQADPDMAVRCIMALTDWAVQLSTQDSGRTRAKAVMRRAAGQVSAKAHVAIQRAACRALTQVALLSEPVAATLEDKAIKSCLKPWQEIVDRWASSDDAELRSRVVQAQCNMGFIHLQLGEDKAAKDRLARAAALSKSPGSIDADFQEFFAMAKNADRVLSAIHLPDCAELKTDYLMAQRRNDRRMMRHRFGIPWLLAGAPRNQADELIRIARRRHRMSAGKVKAWSCAGEPFVLLLRNFDLVDWSHTSPEPDGFGTPETFAKVIHFNRRGDELLQQLGHQVPMVQVASTVSAELDLLQFPGSTRFACEAQLYLSDDTWLDTVTHLITLAETIVIWAESMTPALGQEIAAVRRQGRTQDTIVLLEELIDNPTLAWLRANKPPREQLTSDSPAFAGFPHVVDVRQIPEGDIGDHLLFLGMREHYQELFSLPPDRLIGRLLSRVEATMQL